MDYYCRRACKATAVKWSHGSLGAVGGRVQRRRKKSRRRGQGTQARRWSRGQPLEVESSNFSSLRMREVTGRSGRGRPNYFLWSRLQDGLQQRATARHQAEFSVQVRGVDDDEMFWWLRESAARQESRAIPLGGMRGLLGSRGLLRYFMFQSRGPLRAQTSGLAALLLHSYFHNTLRLQHQPPLASTEHQEKSPHINVKITLRLCEMMCCSRALATCSEYIRWATEFAMCRGLRTPAG